MNIQIMRIMALNCWNLAVNFQELTPTARQVLQAMGGVNHETPKNPFGRWVVNMMKRILRWRMDKLILIEDPSVRVMTLRAMKTACYTSKHVGLIATLYASEEVGYILNKKGEVRSSENVSHEVWCYFLEILDVPKYSGDLQQKTKHWERCLRIDYTEEFSVEGSWDTSGEKPKYVQRDVPPEEVAERIAKTKAEFKELYKYDLDKLLEKKMSGYYERREAEIRQCLDDVFAYIYNHNLDDTLKDAVRKLLGRLARCGCFPGEWLLEFSQKHSKQSIES